MTAINPGQKFHLGTSIVTVLRVDRPDGLAGIVRVRYSIPDAKTRTRFDWRRNEWVTDVMSATRTMRIGDFARAATPAPAGA